MLSALHGLCNHLERTVYPNDFDHICVVVRAGRLELKG